MPVQQQMSSFAKTLGGRVAQANEEHKDKPVDTGDRRLPSGIRNGIAKLSAMYTKTSDSDTGQTPKGQVFFRASAVVVSPEVYNGEKIAGLITQIIIPLCDVPAKGQRKAKPFSENWFEFQNVFKLLGVAPCPETPQTDPTGARTEAYFFAAMKMLCDPVRMKTNPIYISFSTRGWVPPKTQAQPDPKEMVFEDWHGVVAADKLPAHDPAGGVREAATHPSAPPPAAPPVRPQPTASAAPPATQTATQQGAAPPPVDGPPPQYQPGGDPDPADVVAALIETAMNDPEGATDDGAMAEAQLEQMAWANGWTAEQTAGAADWVAVGEMALSKPPAPATAPTAPVTPPPSTNGAVHVPTVGAKFMFAKRTKDGEKLKNGKGEEFPAQEVTVATVDDNTKTCTVKGKDGKDVIDIRTKRPVAVKWDWLEEFIPY